MKLKNVLPLLLCVLFCFAPLAGCFESEDSGLDYSSIWDAIPTGSLLLNTPEGGIPEITYAPLATDEPYATYIPEVTSAPTPAPTAAPSKESFEGRTDIAYVMIYNPDIYDPNSSYNYKLTTGSLSGQIDVNARRADELDPVEVEYERVPQSMLLPPEDVEVHFDGGRADGPLPVFEVGDVEPFYISLDDMRNPRTYWNMTCLYSGSWCNVWSYGSSITSSKAYEIGSQFDYFVYDSDVDLFGTPRFYEENGKVNLLFYPLGSWGGFFSTLDLYRTGEIDEYNVQKYGYNLDKLCLHINCKEVSDDPNRMNWLYGCLAHELQHCIAFTDSWYSPNYQWMRLWINEAMSGFAEEYLYGTQEQGGRYNMYSNCDRVRYGQSLYNFDMDDGDRGVYGSVFLYSEYLANLGGDRVFYNFHNYWRTCGVKTTEAQTLYYALPDSARSRISYKYGYPSSIVFENEYYELLSKLTLDFYLEMLHYDGSDPVQFKKVDPMTLLADSVGPFYIEGGGRVLIATTNGAFRIPSGADSGLIYIGLDANFNPITGLICK